MEGRGTRLEVCGELGDFSILSDFGTCPLFLTLPTPKGENRPSFHDKIISIPAHGCCSPSREGAQSCPRGRGKDPVWHHPLSLHLREGEEHPVSPSRDPPGHLHPLPLAFFPFAPFPSHHPALQPLFPHLQTFCIPKKLLGEGEKKERKKNLRLAELSCKARLWRSAAKQPLIPSQHCSIAGQRHL